MAVNINERSTRRGVYRVVRDEVNGGEKEAEEVLPVTEVAEATGLVREETAEIKTEEEDCMDICQDGFTAPKQIGLQVRPFMTASAPEKSVFKSVITTRRQKLRESSISAVSCATLMSAAASREPSVSSVSTTRQSLRLRKSESESTSASAAGKFRGRPRKLPDCLPPRADESRSKAGSSSVDKEVSQEKVRPSGPNCMTCWSALSPEEVEEISRGKGKGKGKPKYVDKDCLRYVCLIGNNENSPDSF